MFAFGSTNSRQASDSRDVTAASTTSGRVTLISDQPAANSAVSSR